MTEPDQPGLASPRLAQSPWFWIHLFAIFCLAILTVRGDKIVALRSQRAGNAQMRAAVADHAGTSRQGPVLNAETRARKEQTRITIAYAFFSLIAIGAWWQVWRTVLRPKLMSDAASITQPSTHSNGTAP